MTLLKDNKALEYMLLTDKLLSYDDKYIQSASLQKDFEYKNLFLYDKDLQEIPVLSYFLSSYIRVNNSNLFHNLSSIIKNIHKTHNININKKIQYEIYKLELQKIHPLNDNLVLQLKKENILHFLNIKIDIFYKMLNLKLSTIESMFEGLKIKKNIKLLKTKQKLVIYFSKKICQTKKNYPELNFSFKEFFEQNLKNLDYKYNKNNINNIANITNTEKTYSLKNLNLDLSSVNNQEVKKILENMIENSSKDNAQIYFEKIKILLCLIKVKLSQEQKMELASLIVENKINLYCEENIFEKHFLMKIENLLFTHIFNVLYDNKQQDYWLNFLKNKLNFAFLEKKDSNIIFNILERDYKITKNNIEQMFLLGIFFERQQIYHSVKNKILTHCKHNDKFRSVVAYHYLIDKNSYEQELNNEELEFLFSGFQGPEQLKDLAINNLKDILNQNKNIASLEVSHRKKI